MSKPLDPEEKKRRIEERRKYRKELFLIEARAIHGETYNYDKVEYINTDTRVKIYCNNCDTYFMITPYKHIKRKQGCKKCGIKRRAEKRIQDSANTFIKRAIEKYGNKYDYSKVKYTGEHNNVLICCPIHGWFEQTPSNHLHINTKFGCKKCGEEATANKCRGNVEKFRNKLIQKYGEDPYSFYGEYITAKNIIEVECKYCGERLKATPDVFLSRTTSCSCITGGKIYGGFKNYLPGILYYLKVEYKGITAYKIGITNKSVKERYTANDLNKITILKEWHYAIGAEAREAEKKILKDFNVYRYKGIDLLDSGGNNELFDRDILELDNGEKNE